MLFIILILAAISGIISMTGLVIGGIGGAYEGGGLAGAPKGDTGYVAPSTGSNLHQFLLQINLWVSLVGHNDTE